MPALQKITIHSLLDAAEASGANSIFTTPKHLQDAARDPTAMGRLRRLEVIQSSGAALDWTSAEAIADCKGPIVQNAWNMLENSPVLHRQLLSDPRYLQFDERGGCQMIPKTEDIFEMAIVKRASPDSFQPVFDTFPEECSWATGDLFKRHPEYNDYWRFSGRAHEMVLLSNLYCVATAEMQEIIEGHDLVQSAIIGGDGRQYTCLLLEPLPLNLLEHGKVAFIEAVWPSIEEANALSTEIGRIHRSLVLVAEKPFPRTVKGNVHRASTLALFKGEVDNLYATCNPLDWEENDRDVVVLAMGKDL